MGMSTMTETAPDTAPAIEQATTAPPTTAITEATGADPVWLTVFYNGACPVCRAEISHYRKGSSDGITWVDLAEQPDALADHGVDRDQALQRLHAQTPDGTVVAGVPAFLSLWAALPRYRWLGRVFGLPVIRPVAAFVYNRALAPMLYAAHRRRQARCARVQANSTG